ncbi:hypothetical protein JCM10213v2_001623 [Rhodosporidiobolus nylandii]
MSETTFDLSDEECDEENRLERSYDQAKARLAELKDKRTPLHVLGQAEKTLQNLAARYRKMLLDNIEDCKTMLLLLERNPDKNASNIERYKTDLKSYENKLYTDKALQPRTSLPAAPSSAANRQ